MQKQRIVDGYLFRNDEDAALASQEKKKIEYLKKNVNSQKPENILLIYQKLVNDRVFKTPIGYDYLYTLRAFLLSKPEIDAEAVPPVELQNYFSVNMRKSYAPARQRIKASEKKKVQWPLLSLIFNVVLVAAVIAMFAITLKSENPNILNYEQNLLNKYATWEQELSERESVIREKERELNITTE